MPCAALCCAALYHPPLHRPHSAKDFELALSGACTEQELQLRRMQLLEAYEKQRIQVRCGGGGGSGDWGRGESALVAERC